MFVFQDRKDAGLRLASLMTHYKGLSNVVILALPRGGVPVAYEIARSLNMPMDVFIVKKVGLPDNKELAMGAVASGDVTIRNEDVINQYNIPEEVLNETIKKEKEELIRCGLVYRGGESLINLHKKIVILVDDGVATGSTLRAAIASIKKYKPDRVVVAVPVAERETCDSVGELVNSVITVTQPKDFLSVGEWYQDFSQVSDEEVISILKKSKEANRQPLGV